MSSWLAHSAGAGTMLLLSPAVSFNTTQCKMEKAQRTRSERTIKCLIEPAARALANPGICVFVVCFCDCPLLHVLCVHVLRSLSLCGLLTQEYLVKQFFHRFTHSPKTAEPRRIIAISPVQRILRARVRETWRGAQAISTHSHTHTHTHYRTLTYHGRPYPRMSSTQLLSVLRNPRERRGSFLSSSAPLRPVE